MRASRLGDLVMASTSRRRRRMQNVARCACTSMPLHVCVPKMRAKQYVTARHLEGRRCWACSLLDRFIGPRRFQPVGSSCKSCTSFYASSRLHDEGGRRAQLPQPTWGRPCGQVLCQNTTGSSGLLEALLLQVPDHSLRSPALQIIFSAQSHPPRGNVTLPQARSKWYRDESQAGSATLVSSGRGPHPQ